MLFLVVVEALDFHRRPSPGAVLAAELAPQRSAERLLGNGDALLRSHPK